MVNDSIVLVTGGARGIGLRTVEELLENNVNKVYIADIDITNGENAVKTLEKKYGNDRAKFLKLDVTNPQEFTHVFETIIKECGRLDILLNNAGVLLGDKVLDINIGGVNTGLKLAMKFMKKGSKVINTASIAGFGGSGECVDYIASKHAVIGLTRAYSSDYWYNKTQISVMAICPSMTDTALLHIPNKEEYKDVKHLFTVVRPDRQSTESVAKSMVKMLKICKNGSFWLVEDNKLYELEIPHYKNFIKNEINILD